MTLKTYNVASWHSNHEFDGWLIAPCTHHRDSDHCEESNWDAQVERLEGHFRRAGLQICVVQNVVKRIEQRPRRLREGLNIVPLGNASRAGQKLVGHGGRRFHGRARRSLPISASSPVLAASAASAASRALRSASSPLMSPSIFTLVFAG